MAAPPTGISAAPAAPSRAPAAAYMVRMPNVTPMLFLDIGRALAYAAQYGGQLVPLVERDA